MRDFIISTDSTADLSKSYIENNNILVHPLHYIIDGVEYGADMCELPLAQFYQKMREGKMPTTSATNPNYSMNLMKEQTEKGFDILHISFSSALSCSYNNTMLCAQNIIEETGNINIAVVDSLSASAGQGFMVYKAVEMKREGKTMEEIATWINGNKQHFVLEFIVDDLFHLVRGGRLIKYKATLGTVLKIKPLIHVDDSGKLAAIGSVRGRKKALNTLVDNIGINTNGVEQNTIFISHADSTNDAQYLADQIKNKYNFENIIINEISPTIAAHTGVGAVVVSYYANAR